MLRTRLLFGAVLVVAVLGILVADAWFAPWYPVLLGTTMAAGLWSALELRRLLPDPKPPRRVTLLALALVLLSNWTTAWVGYPKCWVFIAAAHVLALWLGFFWEGARFRGAGDGAIQRLAGGFWTIGYLGLLTSFLVQLRWLEGAMGTTALALAIFVPKAGDSAAYFVGRAFGRSPMTPVLSPKKTWEGAAGGMVGSIGAALGIQAYAGSDAIPMNWPQAAAFGLAVGAVGLLGDLMESLIKRDSGQKDASQAMPGFGGLLDVLDSILFSAPVSYLWIMLCVKGV